jgi:hypothetical protein
LGTSQRPRVSLWGWIFNRHAEARAEIADV